MPSALDISQLTVKAPPRKRTGSGTRTPVVTDHRPMVEKREEGINGVGQLAVAGCLLAKQYADAGAIGKYWGPIARETAKLADTNEGVAKVVDFITEIGPYGGLILAALPLVMQLMANHGMIASDNAIGGQVVPPAVLEAQMKAEMARMQAEALREQQAAMNEAERARQDYERELASIQAVEQMDMAGANQS